jgi:competence protein ComEC
VSAVTPPIDAADEDAAPAVRHDLRLAVPVVAAWAVLGVTLGFDGTLVVGAFASASLAVVAVLLAGVRRRRHPRGGRLIAMVALGSVASALLLGAAAAALDERRPPTLLDAAAESRHLSVDATLTQAVVVPGDAPVRVRALLDTVRLPEGEVRAAVPVTMFARFDEAAEVGDRVRASGSLSATAAADASAFLFFTSGAIAVTPGPVGPVAWAGELRAGFRDLVSGLPGQGAGLLPGLAIGDTSAVDGELDASMKGSSLTHLTAVSGANCAIVVGLVLALGALLGLRRWQRTLAALVALAVFVIIVTPEPSVLRATVMAVAVLVARLAGRGAAGVPVLALAVLVLLAIDPWLARSYGFILSVLATAGLLVLAGPLAARLHRVMPMPLALVISVPLAAQLACQPVLILLEPSIPVYGVVANILAAPAAPVATVLGLIACLLAPILPWLAQAIAWLAWLPSAWIAAVATMFAALPGSRLEWREGMVGLILVAVLTLLVLGVVLARRRRWWSLALCAVLVVAGGVVAGERLSTALHRPNGWEMAACDVGQGDAVLVRSAASVMLVDTGADPGLLGACLDSLGIHRIDTLVLTHFDIDHVGGVETVIGRVGRVVAGPPDTEADTRLLERLAAAGADVVPAARGLRGSIGEQAWTVLWPPRTGAVSPGNDASVVLSVSGAPDCACLTSVLLGDLGTEAQVRMLAQSRADIAALGAVDVVKVSHHGSADQHDGLYEALGASLGVIGVGADNTYGHPAPSILGTLDRIGTTVARSDRHGLVLAWKDPDGAIGLWTERDD